MPKPQAAKVQHHMPGAKAVAMPKVGMPKAARGGGTVSAAMDLSSPKPWKITAKKPEMDDKPGKMLVGKGPADKVGAQAARAKRLAGKPI